jgi:hypothetical protein
MVWPATGPFPDGSPGRVLPSWVAAIMRAAASCSQGRHHQTESRQLRARLRLGLGVDGEGRVLGRRQPRFQRARDDPPARRTAPRGAPQGERRANFASESEATRRRNRPGAAPTSDAGARRAQRPARAQPRGGQGGIATALLLGARGRCEGVAPHSGVFTPRFLMTRMHPVELRPGTGVWHTQSAKASTEGGQMAGWGRGNRTPILSAPEEVAAAP